MEDIMRKEIGSIKTCPSTQRSASKPRIVIASYLLLLLLMLLCPMPFLLLYSSTYASHTDFYMYLFCFRFLHCLPMFHTFYFGVFVCNPSFYSMHFFLFRIVIIIMFFVCTSKCGEHHLHSGCDKKNVIHFSSFFSLFGCAMSSLRMQRKIFTIGKY